MDSAALDRPTFVATLVHNQCVQGNRRALRLALGISVLFPEFGELRLSS